jgi:hypothetical protein
MKTIRITTLNRQGLCSMLIRSKRALRKWPNDFLHYHFSVQVKAHQWVRLDQLLEMRFLQCILHQAFAPNQRPGPPLIIVLRQENMQVEIRQLS